MLPRNCRFLRPFVLAFFLLLLLLVRGPSADPLPREKQIDDLQRQIDELTRKLNELRKSPAATSIGNGAFDPSWLKTLTWRSIGPCTMGGRITSISVFEADPSTWYVATASGGLLKTTNNGVTFEHQFDKEATVSIGSVCVAPTDRNIVWVGTGENNPRNSVSWGDGVYKSTDGGKTWKNMGLKKTFQIGKIIVHPKDPNIVYVGALGRLYGPNEERGLFKTTDGGKTWEKILYRDDRTGVIDMVMHPAEPTTLLVAMWERWRDEFDSHPGAPPPEGYDGYDPMIKWGNEAGIYKTTDGGKTWKKLTHGLPSCQLGRIGLDIQRSNPNVVFAVIDCEKIGMASPGVKGEGFLGITGEDAETGARLIAVGKDTPAEKAGLRVGDIVVGIDSKIIATYKHLTDALKGRQDGDKITVKVVRDREPKDVAVTLGARPGSSSKRPFGARLAGQVENVQDKQGKDGHEFGGIYKSTDGGESWTRVNSLNPRPMYFGQVRVDPVDDKFVYVLGVALHRSSDGGKTFKDDAGKGVHADHHAMWINPKDGRHIILGCDGGVYVTHDRCAHWDFHNHAALGQFYHVCVDNRKPYNVYGGLQDNGTWGGPSRTLRTTGPANDDWIVVGGGDGFVCRVDPTDPDLVYGESQDGNMYRRNLKTGEFKRIAPKAPAKGQPGYRWNWNTPFILSSHNPRIFYAAGNYVFRSVNRGDDLRVISPEITRTKRGSGTALSESPRNPDVIWAGTDDGFLWVTRDGGKTWTNVTPLASGGRSPPDALPGPRWVATIEASRFADGRCFVAFDGHRSNDDEPYLFVTEDFGQTWKSIRANLPTGSTRCLREDVANPDLLFCGTEFACWVSIDRGKQWHRLNNNLPTVAVHELAIHPTAGEMVAATHGRSLWVLDIAPLRQINDKVVKAPAHLFEPQPAVFWRTEPNKGSPFGNGSRRFYGENPPRGAVLYYALTRKADKIGLKIIDPAGKTVRELKVKADPGMHKIVWDLRGTAAATPGSPKGPQPKGPLPKGTIPAAPVGPPVQPGIYRVVLTADGIDYSQLLRVDRDPILGDDAIAEEELPVPIDR